MEGATSAFEREFSKVLFCVLGQNKLICCCMDSLGQFFPFLKNLCASASDKMTAFGSMEHGQTVSSGYSLVQ